MREIIGRSDIQRVLTEERLGIQNAAQQLMQDKLNQYGAGIQITQVQLLNVGPPSEVIDAFRDVQAAEQDQDRVQNEAQTYANRVIPGARGQASQIVEAANAYRDQIVAEAKGQADRFSKVYESYKAAPAVTRERIYLDTLSGVFADMDKIIVDEKGSGVVPYMPLPALQGAPAAKQGSAGFSAGSASSSSSSSRSSPIPASSSSTRPIRRWCCASAIRSASRLSRASMPRSRSSTMS